MSIREVTVTLFQSCSAADSSPPWQSPVSSNSLQGVGCKSHTRPSSSDSSSLSFSYNEALRHKERRLAFNVDALRQLAVQSINQNLTDVVSFSKLTEGGFNRTFVITLSGGRQIVARVPYPVTVPKYYAVASEVATIEYLRSCGIPAPKIHGYSTDSDMRQLIQLESKIMSLPFPAGGSLYFTKDLDKVAKGLGVPLEDKRFCVGPDTMLALWYGRRAQLDVSRGPCMPFPPLHYAYSQL